MQAEAMASAGVTPDLLAVQQEMAATFLEGRRAGAGQASPAAAPDVADQLSKLADLRDRGVLTHAEFQQQKAKLLGNA
jgi:Short C-terminal domain